MAVKNKNKNKKISLAWIFPALMSMLYASLSALLAFGAVPQVFIIPGKTRAVGIIAGWALVAFLAGGAAIFASDAVQLRRAARGSKRGKRR